MVVLLLVLPWAHAALSGSAHTSGQGGRDHRKSQFFTRLHGNSSEAMAKAELQQRQRQQPAKNVCEEGFTDFDCNSKCSRDCQECRDLSGCWTRCYNACHREREIRDRSEECFQACETQRANCTAGCVQHLVQNSSSMVHMSMGSAKEACSDDAGSQFMFDCGRPCYDVCQSCKYPKSCYNRCFTQCSTPGACDKICDTTHESCQSLCHRVATGKHQSVVELFYDD